MSLNAKDFGIRKQWKKLASLWKGEYAYQAPSSEKVLDEVDLVLLSYSNKIQNENLPVKRKRRKQAKLGCISECIWNGDQA